MEQSTLEGSLVKCQILIDSAVQRALPIESPRLELSLVVFARNQRVLLQSPPELKDRQGIFVEVKRPAAFRTLARETALVLLRSVQIEQRALNRLEIAERTDKDLAIVLVQRALALAVLLHFALDIGHVRGAMDRCELPDRHALRKRAAECRAGR